MQYASRSNPSIALALAFALAACGSSDAADDDPAGTFPGHTPGQPGLGAHFLKYFKYRASSPTTLTTPATAITDGSLIVVGAARGDKNLFRNPITDNRASGSYPQLGDVHVYEPYYPNSGTALYARADVRGGSDFALSTATTADDEITVAAVEVLDGAKVQAFDWVERSSSEPLTSKSVTTTGPATLIAFWWGDGFFQNPSLPQRATPNNDFVVVDTNAQELDSFIQCAVAVKNVTKPGTYDVTWTATPTQGAQLWLVAVQ